ncbi:hypothetical protein RJ639_022663 [Escallonia herrerae]|uniref:C2H2-type domain-containing protein n=1 Tax=Escallonia herrerae TaxID=1293975 RepID=A0AA89ADL8_9ASTE|nr:hypothetical protein RJ639_022663 [Escallonia herrerae]
MGHKKRAAAPRSKPPPPASPGGAAPLDSTETLTPDSHNQLALKESNQMEVVESDASIKGECERALTALRRGNHTKALRLMKEMCAKHENSALIYRVQGTVCVKVAGIIDDPNAKQRHLRNAVESARKAAALSPSSIEFAHFYANLLYEAANEGKEYEEVVAECERALAIENPIDPARESLQDESQQKVLTADARILNMQNELRQLIQKSNIASLSSWMKNLGNGEEKFRLIQLRRASEDPMELRLVQAKRPNEIKKATKTPEERRKEIEVRVAAARLLQQKSESPQSQIEGDKALDSSSGSGQRVVERRKSGNLRKNASSAERKDWVRSYWNSISLDMKKDLLRMKIEDFKSHFSSLKDGLAYEVLSEALSFAEANKGWKFWVCCRCSEKFSDSGLTMQHVLQEHMGSLVPKMQSILPQTAENEWIDMLLNCAWKPLDVLGAVEMLEKQSSSHASDYFHDSYTGNGECKDRFADGYCSQDAWDSSSGKKELGDSCNGNAMETREHDKISDIVWKEDDGNQGCKPYFLADSWPLSDDPERAKLLEKIHSMFQLLIRHKCLAGSHLSKVIQFAVDELQGLAAGSQLLNYGMDQTPICICFLGAQELTKVVKFLQELSHSCGLGRYSEKENSLDESKSASEVVEITDKVVLNEYESCLLFDERFSPDDDAGALLTYIYTGPTSGEQLASWKRTREERTQQGMEIHQMLEKEFYHLQSLCERKGEHVSYEEALQAVEDLCLEEGRRREHVTEFVRQSYESVLRKRREELIESDNDVMFISNRFELDAISNVLKEAESLNVNQFGFEETYSGVTSHLCNLESGEDDDWRTKDYLHQIDSCIEVAIQRQKEQLSIELNKIDARIMRNLFAMHQLEAKLEPASRQDYRSIIVPLLKSFMRARLEDLAEKDATEKSDAAREAFLAELALDSKKGTGGHLHERTKEKKKNKESRKTKDIKATGNLEPHLHEPAQLISFSEACHEDLSDSETVVYGSGDALNHQEEEIRRRKFELEEEERKLEETLEYQRRIENEAKQKHLAEQHRKTAGAIPGKQAAIGLHDAYLNHSDDDQEQLKSCRQEPLTQKNGFLNILEGVPEKTEDGALSRMCKYPFTNQAK